MSKHTLGILKCYFYYYYCYYLYYYYYSFIFAFFYFFMYNEEFPGFPGIARVLNRLWMQFTF